MIKTADDFMQVKKAMAIVTDALRTDPEYYQAWQANIAMSFVDEYNQRQNNESGVIDIHEIANKGAKRFLDLLTYVPRHD